MASVYFNDKFISRGKGNSASQAAAYRSGEKVREETPVYKTKAKHQDNLDNGILSDRFRKQLENKGIRLSDNASVSQESNRWVIADGQSSYSIREDIVGKTNPRPQLSIYHNTTIDYTRKQQVIASWILAPDDAPLWVYNRSDLWTTVSAYEPHKSAQVARELTIGLHRELTLEQNKQLIHDFVQDHYVSKGMIADVALHEADASDGGKNTHAHVLLTLRDLEGNGFAKTKNQQWNSWGNRKQQLKDERDAWESYSNTHLEDAKTDTSISMKSYRERGINKIPQAHMGKDAWHKENRKNEETVIGNHNRRVAHRNTVIDHMQPPVPMIPEMEIDSDFLSQVEFDTPDGMTPELLHHREQVVAYMEHTGSLSTEEYVILARRLESEQGGRDAAILQKHAGWVHGVMQEREENYEPERT